jgi:D-psicose/D-tagatose/L-ribulose 3-epimerase
MKFALCNEVVRELDFVGQCRLAAGLGYDGLEVAPFTLSDEPHRLPKVRRAELRRAAEDAGVPITGLHWLLLAPAGLSITSPDDAVRRRTVDVMRGLVELGADLGGRVLVHGSPAQRRVEPGDDPAAAAGRALACFAAVAPEAEAAGVTYCIEPLAPRETRLFTTVEEAARAVDAVGSPALRTMIDHCAARQGEAEPVPALIGRWLPTGKVAHV